MEINIMNTEQGTSNVEVEYQFTSVFIIPCSLFDMHE
jgi:hypothetical protein